MPLHDSGVKRAVSQISQSIPWVFVGVLDARSLLRGAMKEGHTLLFRMEVLQTGGPPFRPLAGILRKPLLPPVSAIRSGANPLVIANAERIRSALCGSK